MTPPPEDRFRRSVSRLTTLLSYWTPSRFSAAASPLTGEAVAALCASSGSAVDDGGTVADKLQVVAQVLADLGADAEGRPRRTVPRLSEPAVFADQLLVLGNDLAAAGAAPDALDRVTDHLDALRAAL